MPSASSSGRAARAEATARRAASAPSRSCEPLQDARARRASRPCRGPRSRRGLAAIRKPSRVASTYSSSVGVAYRVAELPGRTPRAGRRSARPSRRARRRRPSTSRSPLGEGERRRVEPERVVVLREERAGVSPVTASSASFVGCSCPVGGAPAVAADPAAAGRGRGARRARAPRAERVDALEPHLALRERPGREVDVRVGEAGKDAAAAEIDAHRGWQAPSRACRRRPRRASPAIASARVVGKRRIHRADDAVLEDHGGDSSDERSGDDRPRRGRRHRSRAGARTFYTKALAPLGYSVAFEVRGHGRTSPTRRAGLRRRRERVPSAAPRRVRGTTARPCDAFHAAALAAGGDDNGAPGHPRAVPRELLRRVRSRSGRQQHRGGLPRATPT